MIIHGAVDMNIINDLGDSTLRQCLTTLSLIPKVYSQADFERIQVFCYSSGDYSNLQQVLGAMLMKINNNLAQL